MTCSTSPSSAATFTVFDANTGELYWTENMFANTWSSPCVADGKVFVGNDDGIMYIFKHGKEPESDSQKSNTKTERRSARRRSQLMVACTT